MRLRLTHVLTYPLEGATDPERDAVASAEQAGPPRRFFVPGRLPCGACHLCRRGLTAACPAAHTLSTEGSPLVELPDRFVTPIDEPDDAPVLDPELAAAAGLVALGIQAAAAANLTPGDVALWVGGGVVARTGAQLAAGRGARSILIGDPAAAPTGVHGVADAEQVPALLAAESAEASPAGHQRSTRRLFLTRIDRSTLQTAGRLADAGASLVVIGRPPIPLDGLVLPAEARLAQVSGYHPDLVPEALALLRRAEMAPPRGRPLA